MSDFKSGFIAITGRPNAGKSTLINKIVGEKVAIVSSKPQTTRNSILAVLTEDDCQMIFIDTPGIHNPRNRLGVRMEKSIRSGVEGAHVILYMVDCSKPSLLEREQEALRMVINSGAPVILALNKIDMVDKLTLLPLIDEIKEIYPFADIIPISAQKGVNLDRLLDQLKKYLTDEVKYFPDDYLTDQPERVLVSEIIREKALRLLNQEVPHGIAVEIERMKFKKGKEGLYEVLAAIHCEKQSHKGIIIGKKGEKLKEIGRQARENIEKLLGSKVYLELWVRVNENWRNKEGFIREMEIYTDL